MWASLLPPHPLRLCTGKFGGGGQPLAHLLHPQAAGVGAGGARESEDDAV